MKKLYFRLLSKGLHFTAPFLYIAIGCAFFTHLFSGIDEWKRIVFGIIVIMYGFFRIYKAYAKIRDMT